VEQHRQVGVVVVTLVDVDTVNGNGASVGLEVGEHRIRIQRVVGRAGGQQHLDDGVVVVGLEPELQRGHLMRRRPVNGRGRALHVRVVLHVAPARVLYAVVQHVHQRIADARQVLAVHRQLRASRRYAPERLADVHGGRGRVHERRVVHVLAQVVVELDADRAGRRAVAGARQAGHLVLAVRLHRARDVVPHVHPNGVAGVQEPAADRHPGAAGDGTARRPHVRYDRLDEVETLVGPERERRQQLVHLRPVRHLHRALVQRARVGRRYGARNRLAVHGHGGQQAPAVGHLDHGHLVLGQRPVVADGDPYGRAACPRPVQRLDGLDTHLGTPDQHVFHGCHATGIGQPADVALLVRPGARVALGTPLAVVPVHVVVPEAHLALVAGPQLVVGDARFLGHREFQVVFALVVERQRDAVDGDREVNHRRRQRRVDRLGVIGLARDLPPATLHPAGVLHLVQMAQHLAPFEQRPERAGRVVGHLHVHRPVGRVQGGLFLVVDLEPRTRPGVAHRLCRRVVVAVVVRVFDQLFFRRRGGVARLSHQRPAARRRGGRAIGARVVRYAIHRDVRPGRDDGGLLGRGRRRRFDRCHRVTASRHRHHLYL